MKKNQNTCAHTNNTYTLTRRNACFLVAVAGLGLAGCTPKKKNIDAGSAGSSTKPSASSKASATQTVGILVRAEGWGVGDPVFLFGISSQEKEVAELKVTPNKLVGTELTEGEYTITVKGDMPLSQDKKTTWMLPEPVKFTLKGGVYSLTLSLEKVDLTSEESVATALEKVPENKRAELTKSLNKTAKKSDAGTQAVSKGSEAAKDKPQVKSEPPTTSTSSQASTPEPNPGTKPGKQEGGAKPQHSHTWKTVYKEETYQSGTDEVWVANIRYVDHIQYRCNTCGAIFDSVAAVNAHQDATIDWEARTGHGGYTQTGYTEKIDEGHFETKPVYATRQVKDYEVCTGCGARR
ncbi:hypothetical protein KPC83_05370 [Collinsella sp. zg1085]|uniref:hypothetical protein n=1 Tax=Collinsella sp. zg1085 TaxID=2844380 RepID=UPI001C0C0F0E|nr:hypothetical protein [Collinsella sp. zg1085]QWT17271.1 hypothetical protein KPC83_05370 [Collinsella sp. zg1085]